MLADFALPGLALSGAEPRAFALTQAVRHYLIRGSRSRAKVGQFIGPGPGMNPSQAERSAGVSATSKAELAGMTMKHITVHPNAQVAQSVEQR
ncbi:MAG: hypothetical protein ACO2Z6_08485, partial [Pseudohongiellaceae bacterium]